MTAETPSTHTAEYPSQAAREKSPLVSRVREEERNRRSRERKQKKKGGTRGEECCFLDCSYIVICVVLSFSGRVAVVSCLLLLLREVFVGSGFCHHQRVICCFFFLDL
jgi:hypothetical protein